MDLSSGLSTAYPEDPDERVGLFAGSFETVGRLRGGPICFSCRLFVAS